VCVKRRVCVRHDRHQRSCASPSPRLPRAELYVEFCRCRR
jgi:hypothetical protein